jgi:hypothetical protein
MRSPFDEKTFQFDPRSAFVFEGTAVNILAFGYASGPTGRNLLMGMTCDGEIRTESLAARP